MAPKLGQRTAEILEAAVALYIKTEEPVSSLRLFENFDFGIHPAMIRHELTVLTDAGYLIQPHPSAGRIPTNKAYEFYARILMEELNPTESQEEMGKSKQPAKKKTAENSAQVWFDGRQWNKLLEHMSQDLGVFSVLWMPETAIIYKEGLLNLLEASAWEEKDQIVNVMRNLENIEEKMDEIKNALNEDNQFKIFIGKNSPITNSQELSVIAGMYGVSDRQPVILCAIGPTRMNYQKAAELFRQIRGSQY